MVLGLHSPCRALKQASRFLEPDFLGLQTGDDSFHQLVSTQAIFSHEFLAVIAVVEMFVDAVILHPDVAIT